MASPKPQTRGDITALTRDCGGFLTTSFSKLLFKNYHPKTMAGFDLTTHSS
jgi:hypothetical protein